jgi:hypothetical protein
MKNLASIFVFIILCSAFVIPQHAWYSYSTKDFSIDFPKKPDTSSQTVKSEIGDLLMEICMYEPAKDSDQNFAYGIISTSYPDSLIHSDKKEKLNGFFRNAVDGGVANVEGKLLTEKEISMDGYPGREFRIDFQHGLAVIKMRAFLVKNKMFVVQTITDPAKELNIPAERFHHSFHLKH